MLVTSTHDLSCGCLGGLGLARDLGLVIFVNQPHLHLVFRIGFGFKLDSNHSNLVQREECL